MKWPVIAALSLLGAMAFAQSKDPVVTIDSHDPAMDAAFARARSETDQFISVMQSNAASFCSVKVGIIDGKQEEYFWLSNLTYANSVFSGTIDNDPELVKNVKAGQKIDVKKGDIFDWLYMKDDKMYGNYTGRVLLPKMSPEDAAKFKAMIAN